ncbi:tail assembly chaperone [Gordonia phage Dmitri]|nr:tail assembly chaperone [Gordonia phage Dmitri]
MTDEDFEQFENGDTPAEGTKVVNKTGGRTPPAKKTAAKKATTTRRQRAKAQDEVAPEPKRDEKAEQAAYQARVTEARTAELKDLPAAMAILASSGITGSDAETLIRSALLPLIDPGAEVAAAIEELGLEIDDPQHKAVAFESLVDQLFAASVRLPAQQYQRATGTLFGSDAMRLAAVAAKAGAERSHEGKTKITVKSTRPSAVVSKTGDQDDIEVEFVTYIEPDVGEWDARVMFLFNQGRDMEALMLLMGTEEVARYLDTIQPKQRDASRLLVEAVNESLGLTSGKLNRLAATLIQFGGEVEADLLRFYNVDLLDLWRGRLSLRRLSTLLLHLPKDSALAIATNGGTSPWSLTDILLADLWVITGKARWGKKAADEHPLRKVQLRKRSNARKQARKASLARAAERRTRHRKVAGR